MNLLKHRHMAFRYALGTVLLLLSFGLQAQVVHEPTSATDGEVKIHSSRKLVVFRHSGVKSKRLQARVTERQGQSFRKQKQSPHRPTERQGQSVRKQKQSVSHHYRSRKYARVFKRQFHFASRESSGRRHHNSRKKHSMARR